MKVHKLEVGFFNVNCYILEEEKFSFIIDPGADFVSINEYINKNNINLDFILNTHGHYDHIGCVNELVEKLKIPFYIHNNDEDLIKDPKLNLSAVFGNNDYIVKDYNLIEESTDLFNLSIEIFNLPGHTPGCILIKYKDILFSGDVLFKNSIGRTDLVMGDSSKMSESLKKFKDFDRNCTVYPGHGPKTNLDFESKNNYYLKNIF